MPIRYSFWTAVLLTWVQLCAAGEAPPADAPSADDKKLLAALREDDFDAREKARVKLTARGESVRSLLEDELKKTGLDPDYRDTLKAIAGHLKSADVLKEFDNPTRITLDVKDEALTKVCDELKEKFGYGVGLKDVGEKKKVTLSIKDATFFEAVDALRKAADLTYDRSDMTRGIMRVAIRRVKGATPQPEPGNLITLRENTDGAPVPAAAKGPVLVMVESLTNSTNKSINFGNGGRKAGSSNKNLTLSGWVVVEPGVRFSGIGMVNVKGLVGKDEKLMASYANLHNYYGDMETEGLTSYNFSTSFTSNDEALKEFSLKAQIKLKVPLTMTELKLDNLQQKIGKAQDVFGGTFTIDKLESTGGGSWEFDYSTTGNVTQLVTSSMGWSRGGSENMTGGNRKYAGRMNVEDAAGKPIDCHAHSTTGNGTSYKIQTQLTAEPATLIFRKPAEAKDRDFEIEIPGIPLP